jgi:hypothetical protein
MLSLLNLSLDLFDNVMSVRLDANAAKLHDLFEIAGVRMFKIDVAGRNGLSASEHPDCPKMNTIGGYTRFFALAHSLPYG